ncbi:MAG TPA: DUF2844 domain-containing protein [Burkholderiales bacterium]|nr:DUF2844 domain-containing protein [Burkholderiales bacterium]
MKTLFALLLLFPLHSWADLGGNSASVSLDASAFHASTQSSAHASYVVTVLTLPSGTVVKEFSNGGTVFGVSWQGPFMPDLKQLLGSHYGDYLNAAHAGTGPSHVDIPGLVVRSDGHMRAFSGQAYLPALLPSGVSPSEIR